jgi:plastocyanin
VPGDDSMPQAALTLTKGSTLTYTNLDPTGYHSLVEIRTTPRFETVDSGGHLANAGPGESLDVRGAASLAAGTYHFTCLINPAMLGTLTVTNS